MRAAGARPGVRGERGGSGFFVVPDASERLLARLRGHPLGREAARVGQATSEHRQMLVVGTAMGANRVNPMQIGEQLPRIC